MEPKFKIGDKVVVIDDRGSPREGLKFGAILTIRSIEECDGYYYDFEEVDTGLYEKRLSIYTEPEKSDEEPSIDTGSAATSAHYNSKLIQPIEVAQMVLTPEEFKGAMKFNIMKYSQRAGSKEGESSQKDWNKALQYKLWLELAEKGVKIDPKKDVI